MAAADLSPFGLWQRWRAARRRGATRKPAPLAGYARSGWLQRHRILCTVLLAFAGLIYGFAFALFGNILLVPLLTPLVLLLLLVIWALPETDQPPERLLEWLFFAYVIALITWPDYLAIDLPALPWITAIRLTGFPMVAALMLCLSRSPSFRRRLGAVLSGYPYVWKSVVAFAAIALFSIALSDGMGESVQKFAIAQVNWTAVFFVSCFAFALHGRVDRFAMILWLTTVFVCLIAVEEARRSQLPWAGHIPSFLAIADESVQRVLTGAMRAGTGRYRAQSKFGTSLGFGEFMALTLPFILTLITVHKRLMVRVAATASLPLIGYAVYRTDSRLAAIGMLITLFLFLLFWSFRRWRTAEHSYFAGMLIFAYPFIAFAGLVATLVVGRLRAMVWGDGSESASNDARQRMYEAGFDIVMRNPIGHGIGRGADTLGYTNPGGTLTIDTYYILILLEFGVLGFIVYYGMFIVAAIRAAVASLSTRDPEGVWLGAAAIAIVNFVIIKAVFSNTENHPIAFMLLGLIVALLYRERVAGGGAEAASALPVGALPTSARRISRAARPQLA